MSKLPVAKLVKSFGESHRRSKVLTTVATSCLMAGLLIQSARSQEATDLLGGFDRQRIESAYPPSDETATGELAKLVYRLSKVSSGTIEARVDPTDIASIGQAKSIEGIILSHKTLYVPERLVEFLEFSRLRDIVVQTDAGEIHLITKSLPRAAAAGDTVAGVGIVIETSDSDVAALAVAKVGWLPAQTSSLGWKMLAEAEVDLAQLSEVSKRSRKPLLAGDADAFYAMLSAADSIGERDDLPPASTVRAIDLLTDAKATTGDWIHLDVETVQVTRITVTQPARVKQLGRDHYFQVDAVADLGNVVVKIEPSAGGSGSGQDGVAAEFENRYPISIVTPELPAFLNEAIWRQTGADVIVAEINRPVAIKGFFFRLWSYQSEYMKRFGDDQQFGPLVIAAKITDRAPTTEDPVGVAMIGWIAALAVLAGLLGTFLWHRYTTRSDREIHRKRKQHEAENFSSPVR